jgi:hypothetical protein
MEVKGYQALPLNQSRAIRRITWRRKRRIKRKIIRILRKSKSVILSREYSEV